MGSYLTPYLCFYCRTSFKRPHEERVHIRKCPECGGDSVMVDVRFKAPKRKDTKQWEKVKFLVDHGFYFQKVYRKEGGAWYRVRYPATLEEAKEFVELYKDQAIVYE